MKFIKGFFKILFALIGVLIIMTLLLLGVDFQQTSYLKVKRNASAAKNSYLIQHVNVIPMNEDTVLANKMVYIKNGIIQSIGDEISVSGVEVVNAANGYLMPGLIDMHVHLWDKYELGLYLSNGVTAIRNVWGMPMHLRLKAEINQDELLSPSFYTTGPKLTGPEFIGDDNLQLFSPEEAREKVISYKARGYDFIKSYYGLTEDIFDALIDQARLSHMDIVAHATQNVPYNYHFNSQIVSIEHAEDIVQLALNYQLDSVKLEQVISDFYDSPHTSFCPTLMAFYNIYNMLQDDELLSSESVLLMNPSIRMVDSREQFNRWKRTKEADPAIVEQIKAQHDFHIFILKKLHAAGVNIICGTDAGIGVTVPGASIHQELAFYQAAGLTNYEVLKTATLNPSKVHEVMNNLGSVEEGKVANLLLLNENPLTNLSAIKHPDAVFIKGRKLERDTLVRFAEKASGRNNLLASVIRYVENLLVEK